MGDHKVHPTQDMDLQKINWKLYFENPQVVNPDDFFRVFNTWIPSSHEVFIDVADYHHVEDGPWTLLVGHFEDYCLDHTDRRLGFVYNRKQVLDGTLEERLKKTLGSVIRASLRLEGDPIFQGKLKFKTNEFLFLINDRALAPNTQETYTSFNPDLDHFFSHLLGKKNFSLEWQNNPKERFSVTMKAAKPLDLAALEVLLR